eukprot:CAMPEP_0202363902 /NCGR_PEP_ID=MMETSP1126-20121109/15510_1 /ASSEMBLY_ACC=CAM_ASM_000457 /TAXON_ID=3047 /ORGANISM="Dunaliella tertiolecta, Strain CCMP1320" /LENGTH=89 /DNA_ID=CAMNT_0048958409 /DNA_START=1042 /DNA_END=1309 /DNA_ORIENTATION=+
MEKEHALIPLAEGSMKQGHAFIQQTAIKNETRACVHPKADASMEKEHALIPLAEGSMKQGHAFIQQTAIKNETRACVHPISRCLNGKRA